MSLLIEFLEAITNVMLGVDEANRTAMYSRTVDIGPFIDVLERAAVAGGIERCGEESFCHGRAVLTYGVEPLLTPEGRGLADVAAHELETHGVVIQRVERPHEHVMSVTGSMDEGWLEARVFASRGWIFLVSAPDERECAPLTDILDRAIAELEGRSAP